MQSNHTFQPDITPTFPTHLISIFRIAHTIFLSFRLFIPLKLCDNNDIDETIIECHRDVVPDAEG